MIAESYAYLNGDVFDVSGCLSIGRYNEYKKKFNQDLMDCNLLDCKTKINYIRNEIEEYQEKADSCFFSQKKKMSLCLESVSVA